MHTNNTTMATTKRHKKNLIVSYKNLTDDLKEKLKETYPEGYNNYLQKYIKPNGEAIYVVPIETEDTAYMVKFEVKIDTLGEDLDKALFDDDIDAKEDEFAPLSEALEKEEENTSHNERHLRYGDGDDFIDDEKKKKISLGINKEEFKEAFGDEEDADEMDSYERLDDDEPNDEDFEPSDDDLRGIEEEYLDAEIPPLDATIPDEEAVVITKKEKKTTAKASAAKSATTKTASAKTANAKTAKTAKPAAPAKPTAPAKPAKPTAPAKAARPTAPAKTAKPAAPAKTAKPAAKKTATATTKKKTK